MVNLNFMINHLPITIYHYKNYANQKTDGSID